MFHRRILPAEEELRDMFLLLAFSAVWYGALFHGLGSGATSGANAAVFLLSGALPLYVAYIKGRAALRCRKKRREAIAKGRRCRGIIRRIELERVPFRGRHGHVYYRKRYYLVIEKIEEGFQCGTEIKTGAYRIPVHLYLKSPEVQLYSGPTGWNWYVEGLQCGMFRQNPGVFKTDDADGDTYVGDALFQILFIAILLLTLLRIVL